MSETLCANPGSLGKTCNLCGGGAFRLVHEWPVGNRWNQATIPIAVWECKNCELVILHPVPVASELPDSGDWFGSNRKQFRRRAWLKKPIERLKKMLGLDAVNRLVWATLRAKRSGRLLDVGAGIGPLLRVAKKYYDCVGLEPSPIATEKLRADGFEVIEAMFEDADIESASFDVVTLDSVIEHVLSPSEILAKINRILRPGGVVMLKTPKFGGPAYRRHGADWNGFRHGYHTFLYSGKTLSALLEKAGFEVFQNPKRDRMLDDILILWGRKVREVSEEDIKRRAA